jgi:hypothetical protein
VKVTGRKTLRQFVEGLKGSEDQNPVKSTLAAGSHEALRADWKVPADVLKAYTNW